jgi:hypothetical protein
MFAKFCISILGRLVPLALALVTGSYLTETYLKAIAYSFGGFIFVVVEYFGAYRPLKHFDDKRKELLDAFFNNFVDTAKIGDQKATIRVNIMLANWCIGSWTVLCRHFFQFYQKGMDGYPDADAHFSVCSGFCGRVFRSREAWAHYEDLRSLTPDQLEGYGFSEKLQQQTRAVKAIVCVPLYRKFKSMRGAPKVKWIGVLNVDAVDDAGADLLKQPEIQEQIEAFAEFARLTLA